MLDKIFPKRGEIFHKYYLFGKEIFPGSVSGIELIQPLNKTKWHDVAELNLHGLPVDKAYGGSAFSAMETCAAFEGFAKGCKDNGLSFSIGAHAMATVLPLQWHGNEEQKKDILTKLAAGKQIGANAITELNAGSNVFDMQTTAVKTKDGYLLNGSKVYITNAPVADYILVYCSTDLQKGFFGGISAFIVPAGTKGVSVSEPKAKMGLNTCPMGEVHFKDVYLTENDMLGEEGGGAMQFSDSMVWERTVLSAMNLGQLQRVFENTLDYCKVRKIKGKALIEYTNIAHTLADVKIVIEAGTNLVYDAAWAIDEHKKDVLKRSSIAKCFVAEQAVAAIQKMQLMYGAAGYIADHEIEREYRDMFAALIYSGTTEIQKNIIVSLSM